MELIIIDTISFGDIEVIGGFMILVGVTKVNISNFYL